MQRRPRVAKTTALLLNKVATGTLDVFLGVDTPDQDDDHKDEPVTVKKPRKSDPSLGPPRAKAKEEEKKKPVRKPSFVKPQLATQARAESGSPFRA